LQAMVHFLLELQLQFHRGEMLLAYWYPMPYFHVQRYWSSRIASHSSFSPRIERFYFEEPLQAIVHFLLELQLQFHWGEMYSRIDIQCPTFMYSVTDLLEFLPTRWFNFLYPFVQTVWSYLEAFNLILCKILPDYDPYIFFKAFTTTYRFLRTSTLVSLFLVTFNCIHGKLLTYVTLHPRPCL
jgi:hypothetical protein